ncbi:MAG: HAMP domain-containing sensor histidine kinase [Bacteriovoracaceae bacterium]
MTINHQDHVSLLRQDIWAIKLRYFWLGIQTLLILLALSYGYLEKRTFYFIFLTNIIFISINIKLHKLALSGSTPSKIFNYQIEGDLIVFILFLLLSGGTQNPFYPFFYIIVFLIGLYSSSTDMWPKALVVLMTSFALQVFPYLSTGTSIFNSQTLPYLLIQFSIPLITFWIARSLGIKLQNAYEALERFQRKEEKVSRLKALGAMTAGLSHEFASPLHAAQLRLERLKRKLGDDEDVEEGLLALNDCSSTLYLMNRVHGDLNSTQFETITESDLKEFIDEWAKEHADTTLTLDLKNFKISCPKLSFIQSLFNLLDNAREAQEIGPTISIQCRDRTLQIKDKGPGFPKHVLERVGEPFNTYRQGGTGLGLYSIELFANSVGADLKIISQNDGSTVELDFV